MKSFYVDDLSFLNLYACRFSYDRLLFHFLINSSEPKPLNLSIVLRIPCSKSRTSRQNHGLKFGMVGTYFRNVKRKGKVIFDHSNTLRDP